MRTPDTAPDTGRLTEADLDDAIAASWPMEFRPGGYDRRLVIHEPVRCTADACGQGRRPCPCPAACQKAEPDPDGAKSAWPWGWLLLVASAALVVGLALLARHAAMAIWP